MLVPRHAGQPAGQPGARAKTMLVPGRVQCMKPGQNVIVPSSCLHLLVFCTKTFWPTWCCAETFQDMLVFVPRHADVLARTPDSHMSRHDHQAGQAVHGTSLVFVMLASMLLAPRQDGGRPAWCSCQHVLASPNARAKTRSANDAWPECDRAKFVPTLAGVLCQDILASLVLCRDMLASVVLVCWPA